jgi:hypothetical protein
VLLGALGEISIGRLLQSEYNAAKAKMIALSQTG